MLMRRSLATARDLRQAQNEMSRFTAVAEERLRIARDLHDLLGHNLSLIALKAELAGRLVGAAPERAAAEIGDVERVARTALQEVREAVAGYRQPTLESELRNSREMLAAAGIASVREGTAGVLEVLPQPVEAALAWTVREGVTNVIRHSRAHTCVIRGMRTDGLAGVEILDDGSARLLNRPLTAESTPLPAVASGNGLRGLAERVARLGGQIEAGPRPEGGFRLAVAVPLAARDGLIADDDVGAQLGAG